MARVTSLSDVWVEGLLRGRVPCAEAAGPLTRSSSAIPALYETLRSVHAQVLIAGTYQLTKIKVFGTQIHQRLHQFFVVIEKLAHGRHPKVRIERARRPEQSGVDRHQVVVKVRPRLEFAFWETTVVFWHVAWELLKRDVRPHQLAIHQDETPQTGPERDAIGSSNACRAEDQLFQFA